MGERTVTESGRAPYDPSAIATPANAITIARILITPVLLVMIAADGPTWAAFALFATLAFSDGVDGYLARKHGETRSGAFLDPLADKVLVLGCLYALVAADRFWWLPVAVITVREVGLSVYRTYWGRKGLAVPARKLAKWKTFVQQIAIAFAVFPPLADDPAWPADVALYIALALTLISGAMYLMDGSKGLSELGTRPDTRLRQ